MIDKNVPLGIAQFYDKDTDSTQLSWSYLETADIQFWEVQYYNEEKRDWVPYDGRNGIVNKK